MKLPQTLRRQLLAIASLATGCSMALAQLGGTAYAATTNSIYSYAFAGATTVANAAAANTTATLKLYQNTTGGYSYNATYGESFSGNTTTLESGAGYKPASGNTLSALATDSVGVGVRFKYQKPAGANCFSGSTPNITQIGSGADNTTQVKLQYSSCSTDANNVFVQCRVAGASSLISTDTPVTNTQPLVDGYEYVARCSKSPDSGGNTTVNLRVTKLDSTNGNIVTGLNFTRPATGAMSSTGWLAVANKLSGAYNVTNPLPSPLSSNTDQYLGYIKKVSYCQASTQSAVQTCLATEVPEPGVQQFVLNPSVETDTSGWGGTYGDSSQFDVWYDNVTFGRTGQHSMAVMPKSTTTGPVEGGICDSPHWVPSTVAGKTYTGSVWFDTVYEPNPPHLTVNLKLREWNGTTLVSERNVGVAESDNTSVDGGWQQITNAYTAVGTGNQLEFCVWSSGMVYANSDAFIVDDFSLTAP